jgi:anti-sigma-K factor RskA
VAAAADIHDLAAAYALGALEGSERSRFERHLESCAACLEALPGFESAAAALALDVEDADPPAGLRERILEAARNERAPARVMPLRRRTWTLPVAASLAAAAACAAVAFGIWAVRLSGDLGHATDARRADARAVSILADPTAARFPLHGARGVLAVTEAREAALVVSQLPRVARGRTYELWVVEHSTPRPAGMFSGGGEASLIALERRVPHGAHVSVSLERAGGSPTLMGPLLFETDET